jgi:hypothetical protein
MVGVDAGIKTASPPFRTMWSLKISFSTSYPKHGAARTCHHIFSQAPGLHRKNSLSPPSLEHTVGPHWTAPWSSFIQICLHVPLTTHCQIHKWTWKPYKILSQNMKIVIFAKMENLQHFTDNTAWSWSCTIISSC